MLSLNRNRELSKIFRNRFLPVWKVEQSTLQVSRHSQVSLCVVIRAKSSMAEAPPTASAPKTGKHATSGLARRHAIDAVLTISSNPLRL